MSKAKELLKNVEEASVPSGSDKLLTKMMADKDGREERSSMDGLSMASVNYLIGFSVND